MKTFTYLFVSLICTCVLLSGCSTSFEVNAPPKEYTVVYGLLDFRAPYQTFRITKGFQNRGVDARDAAKNPDSSNYSKGVLDVQLLGYKGNDTLERYSLYDTVFTDKSSNGEFYAPNQVVYKTSNIKLRRNITYQVKVRNKQTKNLVTGKAFPIDSVRLSSPFNKPVVGFKSKFIDPKFETSETQVRISTPNTNVGLVNMDLVFFFEEKFKDGSSKLDSVVWNNAVSIQPAGSGLAYPAGNITGSYIDNEFYENFASALRNRPPNPDLETRTLKNFALRLVLGSIELSDYSLVNNSFSVITQTKPIYSNINNGLGLFASVLKRRYTFSFVLGAAGTDAADVILKKHYPDLKF